METGSAGRDPVSHKGAPQGLRVEIRLGRRQDPKMGSDRRREFTGHPSPAQAGVSGGEEAVKPGEAPHPGKA